MEKIDSHTLLLKSCIMSSYFESTISDCSVASILYTLWANATNEEVKQFSGTIQTLSPILSIQISFFEYVPYAGNSKEFQMQTLLH